MKPLIVKILLIAVVCVFVLFAHWPALSANALSFDDQQYVTDNDLVQNPSWVSARRFLTEVLKPSTVEGYYQPLTMISLMLDYAFGGRENNLLPFHITSLAIHTANVALIVVLLYLLFDNIWMAAAVGLLFGVHPITVEPIPWISERKTLLAAFFAFWSLIFYVSFARTSNKKFYAACLLAYLFALMSKPTSLPLPLVFILVDYWPLNRLNQKTVLEKIPFFALTVLFAVVTLISQNLTAGTSLPGQYQHNIINVPLIICHNIIFYPSKILWPTNLSSHYAYPQPFDLSNPKILAGVVGTIILIVILYYSLQWTKAFLTGWLIFFITLLPTMQILRFSDVIASDKFAYLPSIGLLMLLTAFLIWLLNRNFAHTALIIAALLLLASAETIATRHYLVYWKDSITLYKHMLSLTPDVASLHGNLGNAYGRLGRHEEAIEELQKAINLSPYEGNAYYNLGVAYIALGRYQQALDALQKALEYKPNYANAYTNLAIAYGNLGRFEESLNMSQKALTLKPNSVDAYINLGFAYGSLGRFSDALNAYAQAVKIKPQNPPAHFGLGLAYLKNGDPNSALKQAEILKSLDPNLANRLLDLVNK